MPCPEVQRVAELLRAADSGLAFTGAGMSTESGISDFRSPGGVWTRHKPVEFHDFMNSREARLRYWKQRRELYAEFKDAQPNDGHRALAQLEVKGFIDAVITQNIDGLHQDGGSKRVIEIHGTNRVMSCVRCGKEWTPAEVHARLDAGEVAPDCDACGGPIKSKTISFGQAMPQEELQESARLAQWCDVCLSLGSSLVVEPAASIPRVAQASGAALVIINLTETPLDRVAEVIIREPIGETLRQVVEMLD